MRTASLSSSGLGQGDGDTITVSLLENGLPTDLTGSHIEFHMKNDRGNVSHSITCGGNNLKNGIVTIPITRLETSVPGKFFTQFIAIIPTGTDDYFGDDYFSDTFFRDYFGVDSVQHTFPSSKYIPFDIEAALSTTPELKT